MSKAKFPLDELKRIIKNNPEGSREDYERELFKEFALTANARPFFTYWFDNHIRGLQVVRSKNSISVVSVKKGTTTNIPRQTPEQRAEAQKRTAAFNETAGREIQRLTLLSLVLPTGKELRDSTVADARKAGGWYIALCKGRKASEVIGKFVSEKMARDVFARGVKPA